MDKRGGINPWRSGFPSNPMNMMGQNMGGNNYGMGAMQMNSYDFSGNNYGMMNQSPFNPNTSNVHGKAFSMPGQLNAFNIGVNDYNRNSNSFGQSSHSRSSNARNNRGNERSRNRDGRNNRNNDHSRSSNIHNRISNDHSRNLSDRLGDKVQKNNRDNRNRNRNDSPKKSKPTASEMYKKLKHADKFKCTYIQKDLTNFLIDMFADIPLKELHCDICSIESFNTIRNYVQHWFAKHHYQAWDHIRQKRKLRADFYRCIMKINHLSSGKQQSDDKKTVYNCVVCHHNTNETSEEHESSVMHKYMMKLMFTTCCGEEFPSTPNKKYQLSEQPFKEMNHIMSASHVKARMQRKVKPFKASTELVEGYEDDEVLPYETDTIFLKDKIVSNKMSLYCKCCSLNINGMYEELVDHCKTEEHYNKYKEYLKENPTIVPFVQNENERKIDKDDDPLEELWGTMDETCEATLNQLNVCRFYEASDASPGITPTLSPKVDEVCGGSSLFIGVNALKDNQEGSGLGFSPAREEASVDIQQIEPHPNPGTETDEEVEVSDDGGETSSLKSWLKRRAKRKRYKLNLKKHKAEKRAKEAELALASEKIGKEKPTSENLSHKAKKPLVGNSCTKNLNSGWMVDQSNSFRKCERSSDRLAKPVQEEKETMSGSIIYIGKHNGSKMSNQDREEVSVFIEDKILEHCIDWTKPPQFHKIDLKNGRMRIHCANDESFDWAVNQINSSWRGWVAGSPGQVMPRIKIFTVSVKKEIDPSNFLTFVATQNPGFDQSQITVKSITHGSIETLVVLSVTEPMVKFLESKDYRLFCGMGLVSFESKPTSPLSKTQTEPQQGSSMEIRFSEWLTEAAAMSLNRDKKN